MINTVIKQIERQQAGKENTAPYYVGEQLKDIIRNNPQAAEIVGQDLKIKEMSIVECEKKIKAYADKHKKNNFACVTPQQAEKIICEFYGIQITAPVAEKIKPSDVENLIMNGLGGYVNKLIQSSTSYIKYTPTLKNFKGLRLKKAKPNEILGISKEELRCIKQNEWDSSKIDLYVHTHTQGVTLQNIDRIVHKYGSRIEPLIGTGADIPKTMRYIKKQQKNLEDAGTYFNRVQYIVDYWNMLRKNGHYTTDTDILYPQNLVKSYNDEQRIMQIAATKELEKDFKKQYNKLKKYCFTCGGLSIHPAETEIEMIDEGRELHHCVATYAKRHASGKTAIFFIRHINEPDKPYFTLEFDFKNMCVRQNSGLRHCARTPEVEKFEEKWVEFVKNTAGAKKERKVA